MSNIAQAQPTYGTTTVENCYQKATAGFTGRAKKVNFIRGLNNLKITSTNYTDIAYWQVLAQDTFSRYYASGDTTIKKIDTLWRIALDSLRPNGKAVEVFLPQQFSKIRITTPKDWRTGVIQSDTLEINFIEPSFIFSDKEKDCLTFDMGRLTANNNIDGLCEPPAFFLSLPINAVNWWG